MDLNVTAMEDTALVVAHHMQAAVAEWEALLLATRGVLVPENASGIWWILSSGGIPA